MPFLGGLRYITFEAYQADISRQGGDALWDVEGGVQDWLKGDNPTTVFMKLSQLVFIDLCLLCKY